MTGVRVPLIVKWPGKAKAGSQTDTPVIGVDFYPTLLEVANISKAAECRGGRSELCAASTTKIFAAA